MNRRNPRETAAPCSHVLQVAAVATPNQTASRRPSTTGSSEDIQAACRAACGQHSPFRDDGPPYMIVIDEATAALAPTATPRLRTRIASLFARARR